MYFLSEVERKYLIHKLLLIAREMEVSRQLEEELAHLTPKIILRRRKTINVPICSKYGPTVEKVWEYLTKICEEDTSG